MKIKLFVALKQTGHIPVDFLCLGFEKCHKLIRKLLPQNSWHSLWKLSMKGWKLNNNKTLSVTNILLSPRSFIFKCRICISKHWPNYSFAHRNGLLCDLNNQYGFHKHSEFNKTTLRTTPFNQDKGVLIPIPRIQNIFYNEKQRLKCQS